MIRTNDYSLKKKSKLNKKFNQTKWKEIKSEITENKQVSV